MAPGRACARRWPGGLRAPGVGDAYAHLSAADREGPLELADLERMAMAAYLVGRDEDSVDIRARAHHECVRMRDPVSAARCTLRLGTQLLLTGEMAQGGGWIARAERIIEEGDLDCVERGWLLVPAAVQCFDEDPTTAHATFGRAAEIERHPSRARQAEGPDRRGCRARAEDCRRPRRFAGTGGRRGSRRGERDLVHRIRTGPQVDQCSDLRRRGGSGARPRGRGIRARSVVRRALLPVRVVLGADRRGRTRRRACRQAYRVTRPAGRRGLPTPAGG